MNNRKIPTVLGVVLVIALVAGLAVTTTGLGKIKTFFTRAAQSSPPVGTVESVNVDNTSFTVIWTTEEDSAGAVFYGKTSDLETGVAVDQRDLGGSIGKFKTHFVKVSGLSESTRYFFKLGETEGSYGDPAKNNSPYEVTTGKKLLTESDLEPKGGIALASSGSPLGDGFATWQTPGAAKMASLVTKNGNYEFPLKKARNTGLNESFKSEAGQPEKVIIKIDPSNEATVNCQIGKGNTYPQVKIGETADCNASSASANELFEKLNSVNTSSESAEESSGSGGFKSLLKPPKTATGSVEVNLKDGQTVSTGLPVISGKSGSKQVIKIEVHSEEVYTATIIADSAGNWSWTPPATLAPGEHTATITVINADGTTQSVTRTFFVTAGQPVLPITAGTPSASLTPSTMPSPTPVPTTDELYQSGEESNTILILLIGLIFITLSTGAIILSKDGLK